MLKKSFKKKKKRKCPDMAEKKGGFYFIQLICISYSAHQQPLGGTFNQYRPQQTQKGPELPPPLS